jgi:hypothetical protein
MNNSLVVETKQDHTKTFLSQYAFIVGWGFSRSNSCVVIQSQNAHGPYYWQLFDIASGELIDDFYRSKAETFPDWAEQFIK